LGLSQVVGVGSGDLLAAQAGAEHAAQ
jgi:hypothetical protein